MAAKFDFAVRKITVSSREIIVVCGYILYRIRMSNKPFLGIFQLSCTPFCFNFKDIKMSANTKNSVHQIL